MANPGTMHVSAPLTGVSAGYSNEAFVAERVFPIVDSPKQSAWIYTVDPKRSRFRIVDTLRAPKSPAQEVDIRFERTAVEIPDHALRQAIAYEDDQNADEVLRDELEPTQQLTEQILLARESALATLIFNGTTFSGYTDTTAHKWDQASPTDSPIDIIRDACSDVGGQIQRRANCVLVGEAVHEAICKVVRSNLLYVTADSITEEMLKRLFQLDDYIVGRASYNSATEDATPSMARLWATEYMLVFYRPPRPTRKTPCLGYHVVPKNLGQMGTLVEREQLGDGRLARQIIVHRWYHQHLMMAAAGQLHTNCVGAS